MAGGNGLNAADGHRHHLAAGAFDAGLHRGQIGIFACSCEETTAELSSGDGEGIEGVQRRNHDAC